MECSLRVETKCMSDFWEISKGSKAVRNVVTLLVPVRPLGPNVTTAYEMLGSGTREVMAGYIGLLWVLCPFLWVRWMTSLE